MDWLTRLFRPRYRLPKPPARECRTVCLLCGKPRTLAREIPCLKFRGIPAGLCEECVERCHHE